MCIRDRNNPNNKYNLLSEDNSDEGSVEEAITLNKINLEIKKGEFVAIIGEMGSGKSSLLHSIIGDMIFVDSEMRERYREFGGSVLERSGAFAPPVKVWGKISLIQQKPWIQNMTIRDNILFGEDLDSKRYNETIELSQLGRDLSILDGGDLTEIGEKGTNLSGGQKARISIARAIYSDFDTVLMDDPLSALDAHVKMRIFKDLFLGKLRDKTRVMVTHSFDLLDKFDRVIVMEKGQIVFDGTYEELIQDSSQSILLFHLNKNSLKSEEESKSFRVDQSEGESLEDENYISEVGTKITGNENEEKVVVTFRQYLEYLTYNKMATVLFLSLIHISPKPQNPKTPSNIYLLAFKNLILKRKCKDPLSGL